MIYYAKSANENHGKIKNREHLKCVGELAYKFGEEIGLPEEAKIAGDFHDYGKYGKRFQNVLIGREKHIDHAFAGAVILYQKCKRIPDAILEAIAGHHDGLTGIYQMKECLEETYRDNEADCCPSGNKPSLRGIKEFDQAEEIFQTDFPNYQFPAYNIQRTRPSKNLEYMLDTRMLFSCLVDADYSVSASDDDPEYLKKNSWPPLDVKKMLEKLEVYCKELRASSTADPDVNMVRNEVYDKCGKAGDKPMGLFTLTAPTGVGKTLSMLHFALRHCVKHNLGRIIVVLPFLTLAEQTEKEYRKIFPDVLVDHSQRDLSEENREFTARWNAPVIITTSVRFFESLFSDNPRDCRKLHHIAGSVVLFDEAQSLPVSLTKYSIEAVNILCQKYRCTMVFSTATQPDFSALPGTQWEPKEILPENVEYFDKMKRVHFIWKGDLELSQVAEEMGQNKSACCIVNLRRHARMLFQKLSEKCKEKDSLFFLTTDLCPAHRLKIVAEIKRRQYEGLPCLVVATQCIEAGVDLDFDVMYRALAPLEAVVQAAGRCNRNGRLSNGGTVFVFRPYEEGRLYPGYSYERAANVVRLLWAEDDSLELNNPDTIKNYYGRYFGGEKANDKFENAVREKNYRQIAKLYRLIENSGVSLIVPWDEEIKLFQKVAAQQDCITPALMREAAPITISCFDEDAVKTCATPLRIRKNRKLIETGYYILNTGFESLYDSVTGFSLADSENIYKNMFA